MSLDFASIHGLIAAEVASTRELSDSMRLVIDECEKNVAHNDWALLRNLPYDALDELGSWIEMPFAHDPPETELAGLWFGLFNPEYDREITADMYVCGSRQFAPDPDDNSWAVGPEWWPEHRYAHSTILRDVYAIAYRQNGLGNNAEYPICLAYGGLVIRELLRTLDPGLILGPSTRVGVAVGFDSGDFILLGSLTRNGLNPLPAGR